MLARMQLAAVLAAALSASCGPAVPVYRITYRYSPPSNGDEGRLCVQSCEMTRTQCQTILQQQAQLSQQQAQIDYTACQQRSTVNYQNCMNQPGHPFCIQETCIQQTPEPPSDAQCVDDYNRCYVNCGGGVAPHRDCVENCGRTG